MEHPFSTMSVIHEVMRNGVMDFLIAEDDQYQRYQMLDEMLENMQQNSSFGPRHENQTNLKGPQLMLEKVKPADRVTFMINYLYMTIRSNQLLEK
jgi:hypothetical protein